MPLHYRFDDFEVDTERFELRHAGAVRHVEPQVFDLIRYLAAHPDRVITRDELIERVWEGRVVSDSTISTSIKHARRALGDTGETQRYIKTVRGRGFRFVAAIATDPAERARADADAAPSPADSPVVATPVVRPRGDVVVAVLPFRLLSESAELAFFADALVEDLTTILARSSSLAVIAHASSLAFKGREPSVERLRADLGVSHVVVGSVRPLGAVARINVHLVDTETGAQLFAERFDRPLERLFELQDEIIHAVGRVLEPRLVREAFDRIEPRSCDVDAWRGYHRALGLLAIKGWHRATFAEARDVLVRSLVVDPEFARAHALLALVLGLGQRIGVIADREDAVVRSGAAAERALELDDTDSTVLGFAGCAFADIGRPERGLPVLDRALELDPSNAQAWAARGAAKLVDGRPHEAIEDLRHGIAISPLDNRLSVWGSFLALALAVAGELDDAVDESDRSCRRDLRSFLPRATRAAVLTLAGRPDDAAAALGEALALNPDLDAESVRRMVGRRLLERMAKAGVLAPLDPS